MNGPVRRRVNGHTYCQQEACTDPRCTADSHVGGVSIFMLGHVEDYDLEVAVVSPAAVLVSAVLPAWSAGHGLIGAVEARQTVVFN